jgi:flagellar motor switch protein FliM
LALIERTITQLLNIYKIAWENVISVNPRLEKIESNPQFAQLVSPNEIIALVTLSVKVGSVEGMMNVCIPHMVVEPIMSKLTTRFWYSLAEKEPISDAQEMLESKLRNTYVPVKGLLGKMNITVGDLLELQLGDVLSVDRGVDDEIDVLVGDIYKFKARPGVKGKKSALKITQIIKKEDD